MSWCGESLKAYLDTWIHLAEWLSREDEAAVVASESDRLKSWPYCVPWDKAHNLPQPPVSPSVNNDSYTNFATFL